MTNFYAVDTGDENITAAAEAMAGEYEVPISVMEEALRDYFVRLADELLEMLRDRASIDSKFGQTVDRKMAIHKRMKQYENADL